MTSATLRRLAVAIVLVAFAATAGCSGDDADGLPGDTTVESPAVETTATEPLQLERHDVGVAVPVTLVAGDVTFTITKVEFSNATPGTYFDEMPDLLEDDLLYVSFTAQVDPASGDVTHEWPAKNFKIVTGAGRVVSGSGVAFETSVVVSSGQPTNTAIVFPVQPAEMTGARFRLDDGTNPPVEVALDPPATPEPAPPTSAG